MSPLRAWNLGSEVLEPWILKGCMYLSGACCFISKLTSCLLGFFTSSQLASNTLRTPPFFPTSVRGRQMSQVYSCEALSSAGERGGEPDNTHSVFVSHTNRWLTFWQMNSCSFLPGWAQSPLPWASWATEPQGRPHVVLQKLEITWSVFFWTLILPKPKPLGKWGTSQRYTGGCPGGSGVKNQPAKQET